jgi:WD40 repeat protein
MAVPALDEAALFNAARRIEAGQARREYLRQVCGSDAALHTRLEALLRVHDEDPGFLSGTPPWLPALPGERQEAGEASTLAPSTAHASATGAEVVAVPGYENLGELGRGGMGVVYKARQIAAGRVVALKMILAGGHAGPAELARFKTEAEAVARLQHPHIVQVYEVGECQGRPFFSLEYCAGGTLDRKLSGTPLPPAEAARLVETLARAVQAAHAKQVIHRDLKPANVLLTEDGTPKVTDFGLAKKLDVPGQTQTGSVLGTPSYMAPEQAGGSKDIGPAADVYALGAILYELLTGHPPFKAATALDTLFQVLSEEPVAVRRLQPKVPRDLETVCHQCLQKDPKKRYSSAQALGDDLGRFLRGEPTTARPVGVWGRGVKWAKRRPAVATLAAGLLVVSVLGCALVTWKWREAAHRAEAEARARGEAEEARQVIDRQLGEAELRSAELTLDRGLTFCERGDVGVGLLWLVRALEQAPPQAHDLQRVIRANLAGWHDRLCLLQAALPHNGWVTAVAFCPDGRTFLTVDSHARAAHLWDVDRLDRARATRQQRGEIRAAALSPDGKVALLGSDTWFGGGEARLWDLASGSFSGKAIGHARPVLAVAFRRDGKAFATGCKDGTVRLWDAASGKPIGPPLRHPKAVSALAFGRDGAGLVTACEDGQLRLWDLASDMCRLSWPAHSDGIRCLAISPDGKRILTGSDDFTAQLWDAGSGKRAGLLRHNCPVLAVAFSPDGTLLITGSDDGAARLWETATGKPVAAPLSHRGAVAAVAFSADGRSILTGCGDRFARLWAMPGARLLATPLAGQAPSWAAALSPDARTVLTGDREKTQLYDVATGEPVGPPFRHPGADGAVAISPDGRWVLTPDGGRSARLWEASSGRPVGRPLPHYAGLSRAVFSPDGQRVFTASKEVGQLWEVPAGTPIGPPLLYRDALWAAVFSPDGKRVLSGSVDGTAQMQDAATGRKVGPPLRHGARVLSVAFSADGRTAATTGTDDKTARLWDTATGQPLGHPLEHPHSVLAVVFHPDGKAVLTGCLDGTARLWDVKTGKQLIPSMAHPSGVYQAAFSPDGRTILTGCFDGTARLWDAATRRPLGYPLEHQDKVVAVRFSPDGAVVVTAGYDKTVRRERVPVPIRGEVERIALWARVSTNLDLSPDGELRTLDVDEWQRLRARLEQLGGSPLQ